MFGEIFDIVLQKFVLFGKLGILSQLCDLRSSVLVVVGGLVVEPSCFSRNHFLMELVHTHTLDLICTPMFWPLLLKLNLP